MTEDLDQIADYILYLENGKTVLCDDIESLREKYRLITGESYKINLIEKHEIIHVEHGQFGTKALVHHYKRSTYDKSLHVTIPTLEELMYFMTKRGTGYDKESHPRLHFGI